MDFEDINWLGVIGGLVGGFISIIVSARMGAGLFIKLAGFAITAIVCYFVGAKLTED